MNLEPIEEEKVLQTKDKYAGTSLSNALFGKSKNNKIAPM
jgi:hypothetical protein